MDGLQKAYARTFQADVAAVMDTATPQSEPSGWFALVAMVLEFDSEDHAVAGVETLMHEIEQSGFSGEGGEAHDVELDIDMEHVAREAEQTVEGLTTTSVVAFARDGAYVYAVVGVTYGEDPVPPVTSMLIGLGDAETSEGEETFREDGTSEGGLWAKMPAADDVRAEVPVLVEVTDETLYPESSLPAVSTPVRVTRPVVEITPAG
jgi:hypothetical protein